MKKPALDKLLEQSQKGNQPAREELIRSHKPFIAKVSSRVCKRYLSWENDDELSAALLAFNEAIDGYDRSGGSNFYEFARKVIGRKLVDFFRKESKHRQVLLSTMDPGEGELSEIDKKYSFEQYKSGEQEAVFAEVVNSFNETLVEYRISLDDLVKVSPKHRDTKEALMHAAQKLAEDTGLFEYLYRWKQLPLKELAEATGLSRRVLEKGRKYIIATALILVFPKLRPLKNFLPNPSAREHAEGRRCGRNGYQDQLRHTGEQKTAPADQSGQVSPPIDHGEAKNVSAYESGIRLEKEMYPVFTAARPKIPRAAFPENNGSIPKEL